MTIEKTEGFLSSRKRQGPKLYHYSVSPEDDVRAVVGFLHGYADHAGRYARIFDAWAEQGIATIAIDMRGHGRSEGVRGYCDRFDEYLDDVAELEHLVQVKARSLPMFLAGHSFGGLVASSAILRSPDSWKGVLLTNPYFELALAVPKLKLFAGKVASRWYPKLSVPSGLGGEALTHDAKIARLYNEDPLGFNYARARWFTEATQAQTETLADAPSFKLPLFVGLGTEDRVASPKGGRRFFERAASKDKVKREWDGLYHELLMELEWQEIALALGDWILERA